MRSDIAKKLVERPRKGGCGKQQLRVSRRHGKNPKLWDTLPQKESCKIVNIRGYNAKYLSEFFPPLEGFLRKNVGRPWNKINSEIRALLSANSTIHKHVMDHLYRDFVELNPFYDKGVPCHSKYGSKRGLHKLSPGRFYVDVHGLLKVVRSGKPYKPYKAPVRKTLNDYEQYRKINDLWFWVKYKHLFPGEEGFDVVLCKTYKVGEWGSDVLTREHGEATHDGSRFLASRQVRLAIEKRQLSRKTIRDEGLNKL